MRDTGRGAEPQDAVPAVPGCAPPAQSAITDPAVVSLPAVVTIRIGGGQTPGEVRLYVRGTYECHIAYALEPLDVGRHVVVVSSQGSRAVTVEPTINGG